MTESTLTPTAPPFRTMPWHDTADRMLDAHPLVLLVGEPGTGKTTWAEQAARRLTGAAPERIQGSPETELAHVWGQYTLVDGETRFLDGPLARALKNSRVLVVEEFNLVPLETRAQFLALRGQLSVRNPVSGEELPVPLAFRLVATSNPENMRCYRNGAIAQALYDDFLILEVPGLSEAVVADLLLAHFPDMEVAERERALVLWERYRQLAASGSGKTKVSISFRAAAHFLRLRGQGLDESIAADIAFVNKFIIDEDAHSSAKFDASIRD